MSVVWRLPEVAVLRPHVAPRAHVHQVSGYQPALRGRFASSSRTIDATDDPSEECVLVWMMPSDGFLQAGTTALEFPERPPESKYPPQTLQLLGREPSVAFPRIARYGNVLPTSVRSASSGFSFWEPAAWIG